MLRHHAAETQQFHSFVGKEASCRNEDGLHSLITSQNPRYPALPSETCLYAS
jgi:hypothetical protein